MTETHFFWAYGNLRQLERLSLSSFVHNGYSVNLWSYGNITNAPEGAALRDGRDILPESEIFLNQLGSYASFSDYFRYALLTKHGGLYADTDVIAIKPAAQILSTPFLVTERRRDSIVKKATRRAIEIATSRKDHAFNNNIIHNPIPTKGNVIDLALGYAERFPRKDIFWGELGPQLITAICRIYPKHGFEIMPPAFANPHDCWHCPKSLLQVKQPLPQKTAFLHCYNDMWRRFGIDVDAPYPPGSIMDQFAQKYLRT